MVILLFIILLCMLLTFFFLFFFFFSSRRRHTRFDCDWSSDVCSSDLLPAYVMLFDAGPLGGAANYSNGFLPAAFQPTRLRDRGTPVLDLMPPEEFASGQRSSLDLIKALNLKHRATRPGYTELDARIASY